MRRSSASFDDPNLVSAAGLVPVMRLARAAGLQELADEQLTVPTDKGANAGLKVASLVAGMVAGADSIDDMALLRHGGMGRVFTAAYAPSTLGSFLRAFTFGHVRQLDAVASRFLAGLAARAPLLAAPAIRRTRVRVDIDDTIIEVHGYAKQGSGYGYSGVRGLNALLATVTTAESRAGDRGPAAAQGLGGSAARRGRLVADALATLTTLQPAGRPVAAAGPGRLGVLRPRHRSPRPWPAAPSLGHRAPGPDRQTRHRHHRRRRLDHRSSTPTPSSTRPPAPGSPGPRSPRSPFTAFTSQKKADQVPGRLVVRRIPDLNPKTGTGRTPCSTPGGSTRSSPPPTATRSTPWPRTRPTAATRSSSRSTPT